MTQFKKGDLVRHIASGEKAVIKYQNTGPCKTHMIMMNCINLHSDCERDPIDSYLITTGFNKEMDNVEGYALELVYDARV